MLSGHKYCFVQGAIGGLRRSIPVVAVMFDADVEVTLENDCFDNDGFDHRDRDLTKFT